MSLRGQALGLAGLLLILDQGTKVLIRESLALGARLDLTPFFALVHAENRGAAFSFLAGASGWQRWFFWRWPWASPSGCSGSFEPLAPSSGPWP